MNPEKINFGPRLSKPYSQKELDIIRAKKSVQSKTKGLFPELAQCTDQEILKECTVGNRLLSLFHLRMISLLKKNVSSDFLLSSKGSELSPIPKTPEEVVLMLKNQKGKLPFDMRQLVFLPSVLGWSSEEKAQFTSLLYGTKATKEAQRPCTTKPQQLGHVFKARTEIENSYSDEELFAEPLPLKVTLSLQNEKNSTMEYTTTIEETSYFMEVFLKYRNTFRSTEDDILEVCNENFTSTTYKSQPLLTSTIKKRKKLWRKEIQNVEHFRNLLKELDELRALFDTETDGRILNGLVTKIIGLEENIENIQKRVQKFTNILEESKNVFFPPNEEQTMEEVKKENKKFVKALREAQQGDSPEYKELYDTLLSKYGDYLAHRISTESDRIDFSEQHEAMASEFMRKLIQKRFASSQSFRQKIREHEAFGQFLDDDTISLPEDLLDAMEVEVRFQQRVKFPKTRLSTFINNPEAVEEFQDFMQEHIGDINLEDLDAQTLLKLEREVIEKLRDIIMAREHDLEVRKVADLIDLAEELDVLTADSHDFVSDTPEQKKSQKPTKQKTRMTPDSTNVVQDLALAFYNAMQSGDWSDEAMMDLYLERKSFLAHYWQTHIAMLLFYRTLKENNLKLPTNMLALDTLAHTEFTALADLAGELGITFESFPTITSVDFRDYILSRSEKEVSEKYENYSSKSNSIVAQAIPFLRDYDYDQGIFDVIDASFLDWIDDENEFKYGLSEVLDKTDEGGYIKILHRKEFSDELFNKLKEHGVQVLVPSLEMKMNASTRQYIYDKYDKDLAKKVIHRLNQKLRDHPKKLLILHKQEEFDDIDVFLRNELITVPVYKEIEKVKKQKTNKKVIQGVPFQEDWNSDTSREVWLKLLYAARTPKEFAIATRILELHNESFSQARIEKIFHHYFTEVTVDPPMQAAVLRFLMKFPDFLDIFDFTLPHLEDEVHDLVMLYVMSNIDYFQHHHEPLKTLIHYLLKNSQRIEHCSPFVLEVITTLGSELGFSKKQLKKFRKELEKKGGPREVVKLTQSLKEAELDLVRSVTEWTPEKAVQALLRLTYVESKSLLVYLAATQLQGEGVAMMDAASAILEGYGNMLPTEFAKKDLLTLIRSLVAYDEFAPMLLWTVWGEQVVPQKTQRSMDTQGTSAENGSELVEGVMLPDMTEMTLDEVTDFVLGMSRIVNGKQVAPLAPLAEIVTESALHFELKKKNSVLFNDPEKKFAKVMSIVENSLFEEVPRFIELFDTKDFSEEFFRFLYLHSEAAKYRFEFHGEMNALIPKLSMKGWDLHTVVEYEHGKFEFLLPMFKRIDTQLDEVDFDTLQFASIEAMEEVYARTLINIDVKKMSWNTLERTVRLFPKNSYSAYHFMVVSISQIWKDVMTIKQRGKRHRSIVKNGVQWFQLYNERFSEEWGGAEVDNELSFGLLLLDNKSVGEKLMTHIPEHWISQRIAEFLGQHGSFRTANHPDAESLLDEYVELVGTDHKNLVASIKVEREKLVKSSDEKTMSTQVNTIMSLDFLRRSCRSNGGVEFGTQVRAMFDQGDDDRVFHNALVAMLSVGDPHKSLEFIKGAYALSAAGQGHSKHDLLAKMMIMQGVDSICDPRTKEQFNNIKFSALERVLIEIKKYAVHFKMFTSEGNTILEKSIKAAKKSSQKEYNEAVYDGIDWTTYIKNTPENKELLKAIDKYFEREYFDDFNTSLLVLKEEQSIECLGSFTVEPFSEGDE